MSVNKRLKDIRKLYNKEEEKKKYDPSKQVEGYKKRIKGSGIDVEDAIDKRKPIEKLLNLTEDQNVLFDIFELINRPQQALFAGISASQKGEDVLKSAKSGFTGHKDTRFKEILHNADMEDSGKKVGFDDILGFAGDVFLDPADLALFPVTKGAKAAKALKVADAASELQLAQKVMDTAKTAGAQQTAKKLLDNAYEVFKRTNDKKLYKNSLTSLTFKGLGTGFKKSFRLADSGLTKTLTLMDKMDVEKVKKLGFTGDAADKAFINVLDKYSSIKSTFAETFNLASKLPKNFLAKSKYIKGEEALTRRQILTQLNDFNKNVDEIVFEMSKKYGMSTDDIYQYLMPIYERGDQLFDTAGKVNLKGLKHDTSIGAMIKDEALLWNQGLLDEDALKLEEFVKTYFADWYKENINASKPMFLRQTDLTGVTKPVNRINTQEMQHSLQQELIRYANNEEKLLSIDLALPKKAQKQLENLESEGKRLLKLKENGETKIARKGSAEENILNTRKFEIEKAMSSKIKVEQKIAKLSAKNLTPENTQKVTDELLILKKELETLESVINVNHKVIKKTLAKDSPDIFNIDDYIKAMSDEREALLVKYPRQQTITRGDVIKKALPAKGDISIGHYFSDTQLAKLEQFAQYDEVPELLTHMHAFMSKSEELIQGMGSTFKLTDGYLAHTLTPEWKKMNLDSFTAKKESFASTKKVIGNTKAFASRRYKVSAMEANGIASSYIEHLKATGMLSNDAGNELLESSKAIKMFADDIQTSFIDFMQKAPKATADAKMLQFVLGSSIIDPDSKLIKIREPHTQTPRGYERVSVASFKNKFEAMNKYIDVGDDLQNKAFAWLESFPDKEIYINNNVNHLIGRITDPKEQSGLLSTINAINNVFKKNKLLSPGFQMRNIVGNTTNMWLSGMSIPDIYKYTRKSNQFLKKGDEILAIGASGSRALNKVEQEIFDVYSEFVKNGFAEMGNALHDIPEYMWNTNLRKNAYNAYRKGGGKMGLKEFLAFPKDKYDSIVAWNMKKNQQQDGIFRMSMFLFARENPEFLSKFDHIDAASAVRKTLFDFQDLSMNERDVMRQIIPFYTFTKKNLAFQLGNLPNNSVRYNRMIKSFNNMWDNMELAPEEQDRFKIENFWIPVPFFDKDGKFKAIKSSLPLGDLGEFLDDPLRRALSSTAPIVRAPFELAMNKQVFSDMPIQEFKGQKGHYIPEVSKKAEFALSQLGLDVPAAFAGDIARTGKEVLQGNIKNPLEAAQGALGRTLISNTDPQATAMRSAYNELDDLQNLMRYYKQEGIDIKTLAEIENNKRFGNQNAIIQRIQNLRAK
jgi:hypothetical protein